MGYNRRDFLTLGRAPQREQSRTGVPSFTRGNGAQTPSPHYLRRSDTGLDPFVPTGENPWDYHKAAHLLRRAMVGPTEEEIRQAVADGIDATIEKLFTPFTPEITEMADWVGQDVELRPPTNDVNDPEYQAWFDERRARREEIVKWWMRTIAESPVSIQERLTLIWHNHFTSEIDVVQAAELMYEQNQLLRTHALGNFKTFVREVTIDMAMLIYLDGIRNYKLPNNNNINENYSRELKELFTMGVYDWDNKPNYTEQDVAEGARALSGWTVTQPEPRSRFIGLKSRFEPLIWDSGQKTYLGQAGAWRMDDVIDIIFSQRAEQVSRFVCEKLYRAFVYDVPDRVVIDQMATTFRSNNWEIKPVVEQLLRSEHFFDATNIGALHKSPVDLLVGMVRGIGLAPVPDFDPRFSGRGSLDLSGRAAVLGMELYAPPNVKGWPAGRTWISTSTLPPRHKFAIDVAQGVATAGRNRAYEFDPVEFARRFPNPDSISKLSHDMASYLLNTPPSEFEQQQLFDTILDNGVDYEWDLDDAEQRAGERIRKHLEATFKLAKFQLY